MADQPNYAPERTPPRDEYGMFWHPDLPDCGEDESIIPLLLAQGFDGAVVAGESEFPEEAIEDGHDAYWDAMRAWQPKPPQGDGWVLAAIYDHENGPHALFVRPWPEPADDIERACRVLAVLHDHSCKEALRDGRPELAAVHRDAVHLAGYTLEMHRARSAPRELTDAECEAAGRAGAVPFDFARARTLIGYVIGYARATELRSLSSDACVALRDLHAMFEAAPIPQQPEADGAAVKQSLTTEGAGGEAVCSAARRDGPSAYCRACQAVGMSNCGHFDECSGATCITCHRPLNSTPAADAGGVTDDDLAELNRLRALVNSPELHDFARGTVLEAAHQVERWGTEHDNGKTPADWFWLVGYLAGKALHAHTSGNTEKALHHTISTAGALANWHRAINGANDMRPGIDGAAALTPEVRHGE